MTIEKIKILEAVSELPAKTVVPIQPIYLKNGPNGLNWQCCLAGSSKTAPRILIFSIGMGADYSFYVKSIATCTSTFFGYIISVLASVLNLNHKKAISRFPSTVIHRWIIIYFHPKSVKKEQKKYYIHKNEKINCYF